jgi:hypothetical protein
LSAQGNDQGDLRVKSALLDTRVIIDWLNARKHADLLFA